MLRQMISNFCRHRTSERRRVRRGVETDMIGCVQMTEDQKSEQENANAMPIGSSKQHSRHENTTWNVREL